MTNPEKSGPEISIRGHAVVPTLSTNGLCALESTFNGQSIEEIGAAMSRGQASFGIVRGVFRAAFIHAFPDLSDVEAGKVLQEVGTEKAAAAIQFAFENLKAGMDAKRPHIPDADAQGRLAFEVGSERFALVFGFNALAEIEPVFPGMTMTQIAAEVVGAPLSITRMRAMFRAALIDDRETSLFEAGEIMDRVGIGTAGQAVGNAFMAAFPKVPEMDGDRAEDEAGNRQQRRAAKANGEANPTKPQRSKAGTGKRLKSSGRGKGST